MIYNRFLHRASLVLATWVGVVLLLCCTSFQSEKINEQTAKALFVYNFSKHFEWPAEKKSSKFVIGIYGHADILNELLGICYNKKTNEHEILVTLINSPEDASECAIVYLPQSQNSQLKTLIAKTKNQGVLIITESPGICSKGSGINIVKKNNRLAFEINEPAIQLAGLKVSAQLLSLGIAVK